MTLSKTRRALAVAIAAAIGCAPADDRSATAERLACDPADAGLALPAGMCALEAGRVEGGLVRHLAVTGAGAVVVNVMGWDGRQGGPSVHTDRDGDGRLDTKRRLRGAAGTSVLVRGDFLYATTITAVVRYAIAADGTIGAAPDTIVAGLTKDGEHVAKAIAFDSVGALLVSIGSATNACQRDNRATESPGIDPCPELAERAGVWRFDAARRGQRLADGERIVTGLRSVVAMVSDPATGRVWALDNGRDDLHAQWPRLFTVREGARAPVELLVLVQRGADYGWPYCYYEESAGRMVLSPDYGGDRRTVGRCAAVTQPAATLPARTAPLGALFYTGAMLPARYRGGMFVAMHGPEMRTADSPDGHQVAFIPFANGAPAGPPETFAGGFAGPGTAAPTHRPIGLAQGPDGSLWISENRRGRIWRVVAARDSGATRAASAGDRRR